MTEERPDQHGIGNAAYEKCIGAEVIIDVPGE